MVASATMSLADPSVVEHPDVYHRELCEAGIAFDQGLGVFVIGRYDLIRQILRDTETFSSVDSQNTEGMRRPPDEAVAIRAAGYQPVNTLVTNDPPGHTRFRSLVDEPFRPRSIARLNDAIEDIVSAVIDGFIDNGQFDAVADFAVPIPVTVIADMLGLPRDAAGDIKLWSDAAVEPLGMMASDERIIECARITRAFHDRIAEELESRRADPREDLLTDLVTARDSEGRGFTLEEMLSLTQQFLVAGNETTTNALAAGIAMLAAEPELTEELARIDDRRTTRVFANEVLRLSSPVQGLFRVVKRDTEINGTPIPAGSRVMLRFAAANRDPARYAEPDKVDIHRSNTGTHVAFGAGIHHCIGANLARDELTIAFEAISRRLTDIRLDPDASAPRHHPSMILRGLTHLHARFQRRVA